MVGLLKFMAENFIIQLSTNYDNGIIKLASPFKLLNLLGTYVEK